MTWATRGRVLVAAVTVVAMVGGGLAAGSLVGSDVALVGALTADPAPAPVTGGAAPIDPIDDVIAPLLPGGRPDDPGPPPESSPAPGPPSDQPPMLEGGEVPAGVPAGHYLVEADVQADGPTRADLTVGGELVSTARTGAEGTTLRAVSFVRGPDEPVGVRAVQLRDGRPLAPVALGQVRLEPVAPTLTVRGGQILDRRGEPLVVRGANRAGYETWPDGGVHHNQGGHEGAHLAAWGMNAVRLPLNQEFWLADCPVERSTVHPTPRRPDGSPYRYREVVGAEVDRFTEAGLAVVLDLHVTSRGRDTGCDSSGGAQKELPDVRSLQFWRSVAAAYRRHPAVAFDLFNEPQLDTAHDHGDPDQLWRDGGPVTYGNRLLPQRYEAVGMQRLYDAVRSTGAVNVILMSGLRWGLDVDVHVRRPVDGWGLVAAPHVYCRGCTPPGPHDGHHAAIFGERPGATPVVGAADRLPVVVAEFGSDAPDDSSSNAASLSWLEGRGLGWTVYSWSVGSPREPVPSLLGDETRGNPWGILADQPGDRMPNESGRPIFELLQSRRAPS